MMLLAVSTTAVVWVLIGLVGLLLSAIYSGFETGWYQLSEVRLQLRAQSQGRWWQRLLESTRQRDRFICVLLIGNNVANYGTTAAATVLLSVAGLSAAQAEFYTTLAVMPLLFVAGEMVPKTLFQARADTLTVRWMWLLQASRHVFTWTGMVGLIQRATVAVMWLFGHRGRASTLFFPRERLLAMLRDHAADGMLSPIQLDVAHRVLNISEVATRQAMTPVGKVVMISDRADHAAVREVARGCSFSRLIVHRSGDRGQIVGFVDISRVLLECDGSDSIEPLVRPCVRLDGTLPVPASLLAMQEYHCPMGIVTDRRGRTMGIVTMKDLVGQIVGD